MGVFILWGAMDFLTPEFFDVLIIIVVLLGLALAGVRLYDDFTRPLPPAEADDDTQPHRPLDEDRRA
jgi:hypothetical protein